ncbi:MAG: tetratricopeptide repeat protein [Planctomycetes bacterium]|nr:tetratricopeptide repeat protein [Planctomycetota bacterium]
MARKRVNKNLVAFLTVMGIILSVAVVGIATYQGAHKDPEVYAQEARELEAAGDLERAIDCYGKAYRVLKEVKYLVEASRCAYEMGEVAQALKLLGTAHAQQPDNANVINAYLERLWTLREYGYRPWNDMRDYSEKMLAQQPDHVLALLCRAEALRALAMDNPENPRLADEAMEQALELAPTNPRVILTRARAEIAKVSDWLRAQREGTAPFDVEERIAAQRGVALQILEDGLKANPDSPRLIDVKARLQVELDMPDEGRVTLENGLATCPDDPDLHLLYGQFMAQQASDKRPELDRPAFKALIDLAEKHVSRAVELEPGLYDGFVALARVKLLDVDPDAEPVAEHARCFESALAVYNEAVEKTVGVKTLRARMTGGQGRAQMLLEAFRTALGYYRDGQTPDQKNTALAYARTYLEHARTQYPEAPITFVMQGELATVERDVVGAIQAFLRAEEKSRGVSPPMNRLCHERLALLYREDRQIGESERYTDQAIRLYQAANVEPPLALWLNKCQLLNLLERYQQAVDLAAELEERFPNNPDLVNVRAAALFRLERTDEAQQLLAGVQVDAGAQGTRTSMMKARVAAAREEYTEAADIIRQILEADPEDIDAIRLLAQVMTAAGRREQAREYLRGLAQRVKKEEVRHHLRAYDIVLSIDDPEERAARLLEVIGDMKDPALQNMEYFNYYNARGEYDKAAEHLDALAKLRPDDPVVLEQRFIITLRRKQFDDAAQFAIRLGDLNIDGAGGATYRGRLALAREDPEEAYREFRAAERTLPADSQLKVSVAQSLLMMSPPRLAEARVTLAEALTVNPRSFGANKLMYAVLTQMGQNEEALTYLEWARKLDADDPFVKERSDYLDEERDPRSGIAKREQRRESDPEDVANLVRLGALYAKVGDDVRADESYQAAVALAPGDDALARAAARFYGEQGRQESGEKLLRAYIDSKEGAAQIGASMLLGQFYEDLGDYAAAQDCYVATDQLVDKVVSDPDTRRQAHVRAGFQLAEFYGRIQLDKEMIEACRRVLNRLDQSETALVQQARLRIIEGLLTTRRYRQAEEEVASYTQAFPKEARGLVARAQLLLARNRREEARRVLSLVLQEEPQHVWALLTRGGINSELRRYNEARDDLLKAIQFAGSDTPAKERAQLRLAALYEVTGQVELAEVTLQDILESDPGEMGVAVRLIQLLRRQDRLQKAQEVVSEFMSRYPDNAFWPHQLGLLLMEREEYSAAVERLKTAVQLSRYTQPQMVASWIEALAKANRPQEAIQAFQGLREQQLVPSIRLGAAEAYIALGQASEAREQLRRALIEAGQASLTATRMVAGRMSTLLSVGEAAQELENIIATASNEEFTGVRARIVLAERYLAVNDLDKAVEVLNPVIEETLVGSLERLAALVLRAEALTQAGKLEEAVAAYEQVLSENDTHLQALNNLAYLLADQLNRPQEALKYAEVARRVGGDTANILDTVGWVYLHNGMLAEAEAALSEALRLERKSLAARYHLGHVYLKQGRNGEAREAFDKLQQQAEAQKNPEYVEKAKRMLEQLP